MITNLFRILVKLSTFESSFYLWKQNYIQIIGNLRQKNRYELYNKFPSQSLQIYWSCCSLKVKYGCKILRSFATNKSCELNGILPIVLKLYAPKLAPLLTHFLQTSPKKYSECTKLINRKTQLHTRKIKNVKTIRVEIFEELNIKRCDKKWLKLSTRID